MHEMTEQTHVRTTFDRRHALKHRVSDLRTSHLEEASTHKSVKTHAGNALLTRDLDV